MSIEYLLLICVGLINSQSLGFDIVKYDYGRPTIMFSFPNEKIKRHYSLNTFLSFSAIGLDYINDSNVKQRNITLHLEKDLPNAILYQTDISIEDLITVHNFPFFMSNSIEWAREYGISLGYHFEDNSLSIIHSLYSQGMIKHKKFSFHNPNRNLKGHFYIGDLPNNSHKELPYQGVITVNENLPTWGFNLTTVEHNNITYELNIPCILHTAITDAIISNDLYQLLKNRILKSYIDNKTCVTDSNGISFYQKYLRCYLQNDDIKDDIYFTFDNSVKMKFSLSDFVIKEKGSVFYDIYSNSDTPHPIHYFNGVILGMHFINKFNYTVFDYDSRHIEFYSDRYEITMHSTKNAYKFLIITNAILCIYQIILLIFTNKYF